ncbi:MAG: LysM peptidoglycan-binding domain-containing protein [Bacteroidetes bacterium]|nr:MAG: LysM peptidoglycan-binding domain-containing protein [Bacteroidota bacterium]
MKKVKIIGFIAIYLLSTVLVWAQTDAEQLYIQRLESLKSPIDISYYPEVKKHIEAYLSNPEKTRELVGLSKLYFPTLEKNLRQKGVPTDLKYLAVALSELNAQSQVSSGASGIWLMPYNVSKMYKLKVNSYVDERKDIGKSSIVVATHFKDLFSIYRQWPLAIAAFQSTPIMLNKSIRMAGNSMHFWDVYPYIPENTREAYPKFIAAAYICNFYKEHGIRPTQASVFFDTDTVLVNKWLSFQQISSTLEISLDQLRTLNPIFKKDVIPYNLEGYNVVLPKAKGKLFSLLKDSVYKPLPNPGEFSPVAIQKIPTDTLKSQQPETPLKEKPDQAKQNEVDKAPVFDKKRVYYTVKKGDVLADVADWFDVTAAEIKSWNKLKSNQLKAKQKLTIWVKQNKTGYYKRINGMTASQKKKLKRKD